MGLTFEPPFDPHGPRRRVRLSISDALHGRLRCLREKLEARFHIRLGDEDLIEYLCEKALERMEEWERRTRAP
jgi:hypothetical protein